jgi:aryl-alcohol dehydrogenase-like predicted oxidoreductase
MTALMNLKRQGFVKKIGVSVYSPDVLGYIVKNYNIDLVQSPLNPIDRRLVNSGWLRRLDEAGIEVHTRSIFFQGLLLLDRKKIPKKFERWAQIWDSWERINKINHVSPLDHCLQFAFSFPQVSRVIVGVDHISHLAEIVGSTSRIGGGCNIPFLSSIDELLINPQNWHLL